MTKTRMLAKDNHKLRILLSILVSISCTIPFAVVPFVREGKKKGDPIKLTSVDDVVFSDRNMKKGKGQDDGRESDPISSAQLVFDVMSVGSNSRPEYTHAQRNTFGAYKSVRNFFAITEEDDVDQECQKLTSQDAIKITEFCLDKSKIEAIKGEHPVLAMNRPYFNEKYPSNPGWICAQKRPIDGMKRVLELYRAEMALPDYLIIVDDDTWLSLPHIRDFLEESYRNSSEAIVIAGCLDRWTSTVGQPWGGFGTFLSKAALENLVRPVDCDAKNEDDFSRDVCQLVENDLFGEKRLFQNGMSVADLIQAYVSAENFIDYQTWADQGYCVQSDWVWGYFFNFYPISFERSHPVFVDGVEQKHRMYSYQDSKSEYLEIRKKEFNQKLYGQCEFEHEGSCNQESHICHYVTPAEMNRLHTLSTAHGTGKQGQDLVADKTMLRRMKSKTYRDPKGASEKSTKPPSEKSTKTPKSRRRMISHKDEDGDANLAMLRRMRSKTYRDPKGLSEKTSKSPSEKTTKAPSEKSSKTPKSRRKLNAKIHHDDGDDLRKSSKQWRIVEKPRKTEGNSLIATPQRSNGDKISTQGHIAGKQQSTERYEQENTKDVPNSRASEEVMVKYAGATSSNRTLVILWGSVRGGEPSWRSLYRHLLDINQADLALMVGAQARKDSSLYQRAKYVWEFAEPEDWSVAYDHYYGTKPDDELSWRFIAKQSHGSGPFSGTNEDPESSGGIRGLIHAWLVERLERYDMVEKYDRFVVTRTDQYYTADLNLSAFDASKIWIPFGEDWEGGICDRFYVCGRSHLLKSLYTHPRAVMNPEQYYSFTGNVESFIKLRWQEEGIFQDVRRFQRNMFCAAVEEDTSRWSIRKPGFVENGISIGYKYKEEYLNAVSTRAGFKIADESQAKRVMEASASMTEDHSYRKKVNVRSYDKSDFQFITPKEPQCRPLQVDEIDFTLVTMSSMDRLYMMKHHCQLWGGKRPISIAVYGKVGGIVDLVKEELARLGCHPDTTVVQLLDSSRFPAKKFPYNVLRNMAMSAVTTSHALYVDLDLMVSKSLYDELYRRREYLKDPQAALVLPTFEFKPECRKNGTSCFQSDLSDVPLTKENLVKVWSSDRTEQETVQPFYAEFRWGQSSTPFSKWRNRDDYLPVDCVEIDQHDLFHWEPYIVVQVCNGLPLAQESFTGYGFNKSSWLYELVRRGYTFAVVGEGFVIHLPHPHSESKTGFYEESMEKEVAYYKTFGNWLQKFVPDQKKIDTVRVEPTDPHCSNRNDPSLIGTLQATSMETTVKA